MSLAVRYKCECLASEVSVSVPARPGPALDVVAWIEGVVAQKIADDHVVRSPRCARRVMEFVKIPTPPVGGFVGQAP